MKQSEWKQLKNQFAYNIYIYIEPYEKFTINIIDNNFYNIIYNVFYFFY